MKHPSPLLTPQPPKVLVKAAAAKLRNLSGNSSQIIPLPHNNVTQRQQDVAAAAPRQTELGGEELRPTTSTFSQQPAEQRCTSYSGSSSRAGGNSSRKVDGGSEGPAARDCRSWNIVPQPNYMLPVLAATSTVMTQSTFVPTAVKKLYAKLRRQKLYVLLKLIIIIVFPVGIIAIGISTEPYFIAAVRPQERIPLAIFSSIPSVLMLLTFLPDMQWELFRNLIMQFDYWFYMAQGIPVVIMVLHYYFTVVVVVKGGGGGGDGGEDDASGGGSAAQAQAVELAAGTALLAGQVVGNIVTPVSGLVFDTIPKHSYRDSAITLWITFMDSFLGAVVMCRFAMVLYVAPYEGMESTAFDLLGVRVRPWLVAADCAATLSVFTGRLAARLYQKIKDHYRQQRLRRQQIQRPGGGGQFRTWKAVHQNSVGQSDGGGAEVVVDGGGGKQEGGSGGTATYSSTSRFVCIKWPLMIMDEEEVQQQQQQQKTIKVRSYDDVPTTTHAQQGEGGATVNGRKYKSTIQEGNDQPARLPHQQQLQSHKEEDAEQSESLKKQRRQKQKPLRSNAFGTEEGCHHPTSHMAAQNLVKVTSAAGAAVREEVVMKRQVDNDSQAKAKRQVKEVEKEQEEKEEDGKKKTLRRRGGSKRHTYYNIRPVANPFCVPSTTDILQKVSLALPRRGAGAARIEFLRRRLQNHEPAISYVMFTALALLFGILLACEDVDEILLVARQAPDAATAGGRPLVAKIVLLSVYSLLFLVNVVACILLMARASPLLLHRLVFKNFETVMFLFWVVQLMASASVYVGWRAQW